MDSEQKTFLAGGAIVALVFITLIVAIVWANNENSKRELELYRLGYEEAPVGGWIKR